MRAYRSPRPDIDKTAKRYFVYFLRDVAGVPVYVGRSCNVAARIRTHHSNMSHLGIREELRPVWMLDVRSVDMVGPFTWDEVVAEERRQIELNQPRGNRQLTARDHRPGTAARSLANAMADGGELVRRGLNGVIAEHAAAEIVAGRMLYDFETGLMVSADIATVEERSACEKSLRTLLTREWNARAAS